MKGMGREVLLGPGILVNILYFTWVIPLVLKGKLS